MGACCSQNDADLSAEINSDITPRKIENQDNKFDRMISEKEAKVIELKKTIARQSAHQKIKQV